MKNLKIALVMISLGLIAGSAQAQTVVVTQVTYGRTVTYGRPTNNWSPVAVSPVLPAHQIFRPPVIRPCPPMPVTVIDHRVIHTGSYGTVHLTGDVYTSSYLEARARFEADSRR